MKFEPPLTALCRLSSKYVLTINHDMLLRVYAHTPEAEGYKVVAEEKLDAMLAISTPMTKDLLMVEKMAVVNKETVVCVSGGSRNIVLLKLKDGGVFDL